MKVVCPRESFWNITTSSWWMAMFLLVVVLFGVWCVFVVAGFGGSLAWSDRRQGSIDGHMTDAKVSFCRHPLKHKI